MELLTEDIIHFFQNQSFVIVSTVTKEGAVHNSCKGVFEISAKGQLFLCDLYHGSTHKNISANPHISITAVDEHKFMGYCLQGKASVLPAGEFPPELLKGWESRITSRITQRVLKNIAGPKGHPRHPEALLPSPKFIIAVQIEKVVDLTPQHLKGGESL